METYRYVKTINVIMIYKFKLFKIEFKKCLFNEKHSQILNFSDCLKLGTS